MDFFYNRLVFHFETEEKLGILQDIAIGKPRLRGEVTQLVEEHRNLTTILSGMIHYNFVVEPCSSTKEVENFVGQFNKFFESFKNHEERETSFIMESDNFELGEGD